MLIPTRCPTLWRSRKLLWRSWFYQLSIWRSHRLWRINQENYIDHWLIFTIRRRRRKKIIQHFIRVQSWVYLQLLLTLIIFNFQFCMCSFQNHHHMTRRISNFSFLPTIPPRERTLFEFPAAQDHAGIPTNVPSNYYQSNLNVPSC